MLLRTVFLLAVGLLAGGATPVFAHAHLKSTQPAAGSTVEKPPTELMLQVTEELEVPFCKVQLVDASGHRLDLLDVAHDAADPGVLHVALGPLSSGRYEVVWRVVAVDGHMMTGTYAFTVAQ